MTRLILIALCFPFYAFSQSNCTMTSNGVCVDVLPPVVVPTVQQLTPPSYKISNLQVTNIQGMATLLKSVGLCSSAAASYGKSNCENLASRTRLMIQPGTDGSQTARLTITLEPISFSYPSDENTVINSFSSASQLELVVFKINDQAGVEARGYTHISVAKLVSLQVKNGSLAHGAVDVYLANEKIAVGQMSHCELVNCGL